MACDAMLNIAAILTVSMSSRCRQLISAIIIATVSTSGAASRRGCPQRARSMFRTVSEIRAGNGRSFIAANTSASSNEGHARSERRREALVANAKDFFDFGAVLSLARGASRGVYLRTLFLQLGWALFFLIGEPKPPPGGAQVGPRQANSEGKQVGGPAPRALPPPGAACAGGAPNRPRPRVRAVRPARGNPWGRSGRLHAPEAARTGPVNALRRCSSWSPPGRWLNGHNGHFSCQPGRDHLGTSPGGYGSGFNGPRAVLKALPSIAAQQQVVCVLYML